MGLVESGDWLGKGWKKESIVQPFPPPTPSCSGARGGSEGDWSLPGENR